jgi:3-oxoacyl-[acyl-carrier-protein] synthase III
MTVLTDQACIVGIGETAYTRGSGKSVLRLVLEATKNALDDAGLAAEDIDGFVLSAHYVNQEQLAANLGIEDLR